MKNISEREYLQDIDILKDNLIKYHPNPYNFLTKEKLENEFKALEQSISLRDFALGIMKLLAKLKDGHTELCPSTEFLGIKNYPIKMKFFSDGYYLIKTSKEYERYLGKRVERINGKDMDEIEEIFSEIIPQENTESMKYYISSQLKEPVLCKYLGINDGGDLDITFGNGEDISIKAVDFNNELIDVQKTQIEKGMYWSKRLEDMDTLYFQYNKCEEDVEYPISKVIEEIEDSKLNKIIVDLRFNKGGNSEVLQPLIDYLKGRDMKVIVFTGLDTYSSGIINLIELSKINGSITIGEIPHGSPTHYGEYMKLKLPNTNLELKISTKYFKYDGYELGDVFKPIYEIKQSIDEYIEGKDVCMEVAKDM